MGMEFGKPQPGYNPAVHGAYHPGRWYGKADTHWKDVKLAELPSWLSRRSPNPIDMGRATARAYYRWNIKWLSPKKAGAAPFVHWIGLFGITYYFLTYKQHKCHRRAKYH